jgi:hypothetical protein
MDWKEYAFPRHPDFFIRILGMAGIGSGWRESLYWQAGIFWELPLALANSRTEALAAQ